MDEGVLCGELEPENPSFLRENKRNIVIMLTKTQRFSFVAILQAY